MVFGTGQCSVYEIKIPVEEKHFHITARIASDGWIDGH